MGLLSDLLKQELIHGGQPFRWGASNASAKDAAQLVGTFVQGIEGQPIQILAARINWLYGLIVRLDPERPDRWLSYADLVPLDAPPVSLPRPPATPRADRPPGYEAHFIGGPWAGLVKRLAQPPLDLYVPLADQPLTWDSSDATVAVRYVRYHRTAPVSAQAVASLEYRVKSD